MPAKGCPSEPESAVRGYKYTAVPTPELWVVVVAALSRALRETPAPWNCRGGARCGVQPYRLSLGPLAPLPACVPRTPAAHKQGRLRQWPTKYRVALPINPIIWVVSGCFPLGLASGRGKHPAPFCWCCNPAGFWGAVPPPPAGGSPPASTTSPARLSRGVVFLTRQKSPPLSLTACQPGGHSCSRGFKHPLTKKWRGKPVCNPYTTPPKKQSRKEAWTPPFCWTT